MRYSKQGSLYKRRMLESFQTDEETNPHRDFQVLRPAYQLTWTCRGHSAQQLAWARAIYDWWRQEGSLDAMPKEPQDTGRKARGNSWRAQIKAWAEEGKCRKSQK